MRTIGVSCAANDWIASVGTTFGTVDLQDFSALDLGHVVVLSCWLR
jgi:hypothetical protein